ncbi:MAG: protein-export chaperone SecB [Pseudomonadota bacterium]
MQQDEHDQNTHMQISMIGQYLKDLSFENPNAPQSLEQPGENPNIQIEIGVNGRKIKDDIFEVVLEFTADAKSEKHFIYKVELAYAGLFQLKNIQEKALQQILMITCPNYIFPFVRALILQMTQEGSFPPLQLDPIDFAALYKQNMSDEIKSKQMIN